MGVKLSMGWKGADTRAKLSVAVGVCWHGQSRDAASPCIRSGQSRSISELQIRCSSLSQEAWMSEYKSESHLGWPAKRRG